MLKVTINGVEYYSDPTNYDSGVVGVLGMTPGYREDSCGGGLVTANYSTGADTSANSYTVLCMEANKVGMVPIVNKNGTTMVEEKPNFSFTNWTNYYEYQNIFVRKNIVRIHEEYGQSSRERISIDYYDENGNLIESVN